MDYAVHEVAKSQTRLSDSHFSQCRRCRRPRFYPWVRKMSWRRVQATHSSVLAGKIPWTEEPCRLQSMGSQRARHSTGRDKKPVPNESQGARWGQPSTSTRSCPPAPGFTQVYSQVRSSTPSQSSSLIHQLFPLPSSGTVSNLIIWFHHPVLCLLNALSEQTCTPTQPTRPWTRGL